MRLKMRLNNRAIIAQKIAQSSRTNPALYPALTFNDARHLRAKLRAIKKIGIISEKCVSNASQNASHSYPLRAIV